MRKVLQRRSTYSRTHIKAKKDKSAPMVTLFHHYLEQLYSSQKEESRHAICLQK